MALEFGNPSIFPAPASQLENEIQSGVPQNRAQFYFVGKDTGITGIGATAVETELLTLIIPKYTITNGIMLRFLFAVEVDSAGGETATLRIKVGPDGSEVTQQSVVWEDSANLRSGELEATPTAVDYQGKLRYYEFVVDDVNWTEEQSVSVTVQFSDSDLSNQALATSLIVTGF